MPVSGPLASGPWVQQYLKDGLSKISRATGLSMAEITRRWLSYGLEQAEHASKVSA